MGGLVEGGGVKMGLGRGYIKVFEDDPDKKDEAQERKSDDRVPEPGWVVL